MSGAMRKMGVYLGLVEDEEHEAHVAASRGRSHDYDASERRAERDRYDYDDEADHAYEADDHDAPGPAYRRPQLESYGAPEDELRVREEPTDRSAHRITTLHPRTYSEARTIGEQFRDGNPVIMNLTEMDDADAKRLVDFAAGITFGLRGSIERITTKVFLLSPQKVKVTAEDKARIADGRYPSRG